MQKNIKITFISLIINSVMLQYKIFMKICFLAFSKKYFEEWKKLNKQ